MGCSFSSRQPHPAREPAALLNTGAGNIIRIPNPAGGVSSYEHCSRLMVTHALIADEIVTGNAKQKTKEPSRVAVVIRPGIQNQALKGSVVYLKKTSRSSSYTS